MKDTENGLDLKVNLCDTCQFSQPECDCNTDTLVYGTAIGGDNVIFCETYEEDF